MQNRIIRNIVFSFFKVKGIYILTLCGIIISALSTIIPYIIGVFINSILSSNSIVFTFSLLFCFSCMLVYSKKFYSYLITSTSKFVTLRLQKKYLNKIYSYTPSDLEKFPNGELGLKFLRDIPILTDFVRHLYPQLVEITCGAIFALFFVFYTNCIVGVLFIVILPITLFLIYPFSKVFSRISSISRRNNDNVFCRIFEIFYSLPFFKSISADYFYNNQSQSKLASIAKITYISGIYEAKFNFYINLLLAIGELTVLGVSAYFAHIGTIKIGDVIFYQLIFVSSFNSFSSIYKMLPNWALIKESIISLNELDILKPEQSNQNDFMFNGNIELKNVTFSYDLNSKPILENFSLIVNSGDFVFIDGMNGIGKTTLLKILCGYLHPRNGSVLFDGVDINNVNLNCLRKRISIVSQDFLLVSDSIRNNITLHDNKYTFKEINDVLDLVGLKSLIEKLPNGIDEVVGNNGRKLSGGEIQKVAIARALIRKPRLMILDEITNHLDQDAHITILKIIASLRHKTTLLLVSHDTTTSYDFDRIINITN